MGEHAYAVLEFTRFLQARPDSTRALFQRALAHLAAGQWDQAVADFDRVIALDPDDREARERREQAVEDRDRERPAAAVAAPPESPGELKPETPTPPTQATPNGAPAARPDVLWLTCPVCGASAQISWRRLDRTFQCRGCSRLFHADAGGK